VPKKGPDAAATTAEAATQGSKKWGRFFWRAANQSIYKENPMSLGVLNNLNAISAENNLSNTQNSLSKVLNQLSSGSRINSGADDAAGLSLVNGLQANSMALTQSKTNATEGVGLLTVADGALSQVNNLLNRAVTLATERHPQHFAGHGGEPGIPVDFVGDQQHWLDHDLQQHRSFRSWDCWHLYRRLFDCGRVTQ
jgi:Bacterial flagellin N-terminal helical region